MPNPTDPRLSEALSILEPSFRCDGLEGALTSLLAPALVRAGLAPDGVATVLDAVRQREGAGSTAMGPVALPHARVPGLHRIVAGLGANPDGVFPGNRETTFVLTFVSPASSAADHLRFLARAAQLFRDDEARTKLLAAADREGMLEVLRSVER